MTEHRSDDLDTTDSIPDEPQAGGAPDALDGAVPGASVPTAPAESAAAAGPVATAPTAPPEATAGSDGSTATPGVSALPPVSASGPMPPRREGNKVALWVALAAALLLGVVAFMSLRGGGHGGSESDWLALVAGEMPANAGLVMATPGLDTLRNDPLLGSLVNEMVAEYIDEFEEVREELGFVDDAPVGIGFVFGDFGPIEEPFIVLVSFGTSHGRAALASRLRSELDEWPGSAMVDVRGSTWACGPDEVDPGYSNCIGLIGRRMMIIRTPPGVETSGDLIAELTGADGSPRLDSLEAYADASSFPPGAIATMVIDGDAVGDAFERIEPGGGLLFESFGFVTMAAYSSEDDVTFRMNSFYAPDSPEARTMTRMRDRSRIDHLPMPLLAGVHFRYDLNVFVEHQIETFLNNPAFRDEMDLDELDGAIATAEEMLGMRLREDLLPAFDGEFLLAVHSLDFMSLSTRPFATIGLGVADAATVERFLGQLDGFAALAQVPVTQSTQDGITFRHFEFDGESMQVALHDDVLWIANGRDVLTRALTGQLPTVAAAENPNETVRYLTGEEGAFAMVIDISGIINAVPLLAMIGITAPPPLENGDPAILMTWESQPQQDGFSTSTLRIRGLAPLIQQVRDM